MSRNLEGDEESLEAGAVSSGEVQQDVRTTESTDHMDSSVAQEIFNSGDSFPTDVTTLLPVSSSKDAAAADAMGEGEMDTIPRIEDPVKNAVLPVHSSKEGDVLTVKSLGDDEMDTIPPSEDPASEASASTSLDEIKTRMLNRLACSDVHFKHQQRGEPDLTHKEKVVIAREILEKPSIFLARFGKYLEEEDLPCFHSVEDDYIISFHLKEIRERLNVHKNFVVVRNRRFEAMKKLVAEGEYFSDEELKYRDPLLYEQMVGQYLTDEEVTALVNKSDLRFSTILIQNLQMIQNNEIYERQKNQEACQMDDSDEEAEKKEEDCALESDESELESEDEQLPQEERELLRAEFLRTMQLRFLNGEDKEFNYSEVDTNVDYDPLDIRERDEQERYFDEEEPEMLQDMAENALPIEQSDDCGPSDVSDNTTRGPVPTHKDTAPSDIVKENGTGT